MTDSFEEAQAAEALAPERDLCARRVLEFMSACGVRTSTMPPQLIEWLTLYGMRAMAIGQELAHRKSTLLTPPEGSAGAEAAGGKAEARGESSGLLPTATGGKRRRRGSAEITRKIVLNSR